jgi:hypothetical protein
MSAIRMGMEVDTEDFIVKGKSKLNAGGGGPLFLYVRADLGKPI